VVGELPGAAGTGGAGEVTGSLATRLGDRVLASAEGLGDFVRLIGGTLRALGRRRPPLAELLWQMRLIGVRSTAIVAVTATFTGMVFSLQTAFALERFGAKPYVGGVLALALLRELGPALAAVMFAGRVGAGITAELASMKVTEQVDAIRAMGADPLQKLVLPRVAAAVLSLPLLAVFADVLGIAGGMLVAATQYGIPAHFFLRTVTYNSTVEDLVSGIVKTFFFGAIIGWIGCYMGLGTRGGTVGVGRATTRAVVSSSIAVLVADFFLTKVLLAL